MLRRAVVLAACLLAILPASPAFAQDGKTKHWGVSFSYTPSWKGADFWQDMLLVENADPPFEGNEFTIGFVRGATLGGDWGVSYVRKAIKDGFSTTSTETISGSIPGGTYTNQSTDVLVFQKVYYDGIEVHFFIPFVNIKNRVQIGINAGGGLGWTKGNIQETSDSVYTFTPTTGPPQAPQISHQVTEGPATDVILAYQPLGKVEGQVAFIAAPGLKIKASVGMNIPSNVAFRIGAVFLFGAK